jgi:hypothetical protein
VEESNQNYSSIITSKLGRQQLDRVKAVALKSKLRVFRE